MGKQWRSLEDLSGSKAIDSFRHREFSERSYSDLQGVLFRRKML